MMHCRFAFVYMYVCMHVCIAVTVNFGHLDCTIATDTQQRDEQLEAILSQKL